MALPLALPMIVFANFHSLALSPEQLSMAVAAPLILSRLASLAALFRSCRYCERLCAAAKSLCLIACRVSGAREKGCSLFLTMVDLTGATTSKTLVTSVTMMSTASSTSSE